MKTNKRLALISMLLLLATVVMFIVFILAVTGVIPVSKKSDEKEKVCQGKALNVTLNSLLEMLLVLGP